MPTSSSQPQQAQVQPEHDLESIGRNCEYEYCHQLDFLPFKCDSCKGTFCLEHRTETAHKCSHAGEAAAAKRRLNSQSPASSQNSRTQGYTLAGSNNNNNQKPTVYNSDQCSHPSCKTFIHTLKDQGVHCQDCKRDYCLRHRLKEEHDCSKLTPLGVAARTGAGQQRPQEALRSMFSKVKAWGGNSPGSQQQQTTSSTVKKSSTSSSGLGSAFSGLPASVRARLAGSNNATGKGSAIAQMNELKRTAKGDASVPADRRLYLHVVGTSEADAKSTTTTTSEPPSGKFFYDSRWKVGRVLDDAAKRLKIENLNNRASGEEAKLRIFHVESGEFLEFSDAIGAGKVKNGNTIVLLRGAGVVLGK